MWGPKNKSRDNDAAAGDSPSARVVDAGGTGRGDGPKAQCTQNKTPASYCCLQGRLNSS